MTSYNNTTNSKTCGPLTAALILIALSSIALSSAAQQSPDQNDPPRPRKHLTHSGTYSVPAGDKNWILYHDAEQAKIDRLQAELNDIQRKVDKEMMKTLIGDLVEDKILADAKDLQWLSLTEDKLIVNGRKQSRALHRKFVKKYIYKHGFGIFYGDPDGQKNGSSD